MDSTGSSPTGTPSEKETSPASRAYLAAADRQTEVLADADLFGDSLMLNVLFEEEFVIPDIFFFISPTIARHVLKKKYHTSLLAAAIGQEICKPVFRTGGSFREVLAAISPSADQTAAIRGVREDAPWVAEVLDADVGGFQPEPMPAFDVGERYENMVCEALLPDDDEVPDSILETAWEGLGPSRIQYEWRQTAPWRHEVVPEAIRRTHKVAGRGLRNGAIAEALAERFDIDTSDGPFLTDPYNIILKAARHERKHVEIFLRWTRDLYLANQARSYKARPSVPRPHPVGSAFVLKDTAAAMQRKPEEPSRRPLDVTELLPSFDALYKLRPSEIIAIRQDKGKEYFAAVRDWEKEPSGNNADNVRHRLTAYSSELMRAAKSPATHRLQVIGGGLESMGSVASLFGPSLPAVSMLAVGGSISLIYCISKVRPVHINFVRGEVTLLPERLTI